MVEGLVGGCATMVLNLEDIAFVRVPSDWVVEREEGGDIAIYEDRPGSGTLRPFIAEYIFDNKPSRDLAAQEAHNGQSSEPLSGNARLSRAVYDGVEGGEALRLHQWLVTIPTGEDRLRLVTFTHTIETASDGTHDANSELQIVDLAVRGAFYPEATPASAT